MELDGKTAVITGAASGIGLALAYRFGAAGMNLVLADVEVPALEAAAAALVEAGYPVAQLRVDVRNLDEIRGLEKFARERFGDVHVLCNNAGVAVGEAVSGTDDLERWRWTIDVNLWGVIYGCKVFLPAMIEHGEPAHIVNTASMAGHASAPLMGAYNISKYGVVALSETLAREMQMNGATVGVSVLCPAFVATGIATSSRNRPEEISAAEAAATAEGQAFQEFLEGLVAGGIAAEDVADQVHDSVVNNNFWILTHPEVKPAITKRAQDIVDGVNPTLQEFGGFDS